jgi:predicted nuclease with TOPRIM domain
MGNSLPMRVLRSSNGDHAMTDETANLILEHLRALRGGQDRLTEHMERLETRMTSLEQHIASLRQDIALLHGDFAGQSVRLDRLESRFGRIERRLELSD